MDIVDLRHELATVLQFADSQESLISHFFDWVTRRIAVANIAVYLYKDGEQHLRGYCKNTETFSKELGMALEKEILPVLETSTLVMYTSWAANILPNKKYFQLMAIRLVYTCKPIGTVVIFLPSSFPPTFQEEQIALLKMAEVVLSTAVTTIAHKRSNRKDDDTSEGLWFDEESGERKGDPADWWKNGDSPPF